MDEQIQLVVPDMEDEISGDIINRPELWLYESQKQTVDIRRHALRAGYMPKFGLFAQGGYGNPGLDMLKDKFTAYYIIGARLTWNFGSLYTLKNDKQKLDTQRQQIESNRNLFLFNTHLKLAEQRFATANERRRRNYPATDQYSSGCRSKGCQRNADGYRNAT